MEQNLFTTEQLVERWEARRRILNVMGIFSQHHLLKKERDIFGGLWSAADDVCLGTNDGWYIGREAVGGYYDAMDRRNVLTNQLLRRRFPEKLADKTEEETYGIGSMNYFPLDTPVIEIAADGQTAKGIWSLRNTYSQLEAGGPKAYWQWAWIAVDFVHEADDWKIWHLLLLNEVHVPAGKKLHEAPDAEKVLPEFAELAAFAMPAPTVPETLREAYSTSRAFAQPPRLPEPYATFADTFSYGKE